MLQSYKSLRLECTPEQIRKLDHVENRRKQYWLWVLDTIIQYQPIRPSLDWLLNVEVEDIPDCEGFDYMRLKAGCS